MLLVVVMFVLSIVLIIFNFKTKQRDYIEAINKFNGPPTLPILGNVLDVLGSPKVAIKKVMKLHDKYGTSFRFWLMHKPYIIISSGEDFETVVCETLEKDNIHELITEIVGDGMFTAGVEKWKRGRRLFNPAFNTNILSWYFLDVFNKQNMELISRLNKQVGADNHFDLWIYFIERSVSTICETTLDYDDMEHGYNLPQFIEASTILAELFSQRSYTPWMQPSIFFKLYLYLSGKIVYKERVYAFAKEILRAKRQKMKNEYCNISKDVKNEKSVRKLIDILLEKNIEESDTFTEDEMESEIIAVLFAGSETSAVTACFVLLVFAIRQDIQEKAYQEMCDIFEDDNRLPTLDDLQKMVFLEQCIKETLRRFPVVPFIFRYTDHDIHLSKGRVIPANTSITLAIMALHHNKEVFPNPLTWNVDNFSPENVSSRHKSSFLPFSTGPRGCIGKKYAWLSLKAQLSTVLRNYKFLTDVKMEDIQIKPHLTVKSENGYNVKIKYRHGKSLF